jgi:hypothetical protein
LIHLRGWFYNYASPHGLEKICVYLRASVVENAMALARARARPGGRFRRRAVAPENSPAIHGWVHGSGMFQVPPGTKEIFCRPSRDF